MKKWAIMVVDDEMPAQETIKDMLPWEQTNFYIKEFAKNGEEALEKLNEDIDIIITDIQMPVMDGIELIKEIKRRKMPQMIIVLSCHEEFRYAREAMNYGIKDYLIKDLITPSDLLLCLKRLESEKGHELNNKNEFTVKLEHDYYMEILRNKILEPQVVYKKNIKTNELLEKLNIHYLRYCVFSILLDMNEPEFKYYSDEKTKLLINKVVAQLNDHDKGNFFGFYHRKYQFVVVAKMDQTSSQLMYYNESYRLCELLRRKISYIGVDSVTIGISKKFHLPNEFHEHYLSALNASKLRVFNGYNRNIFSENLLIKNLSKNIEFLNVQLDHIARSMENHQLVETRRLLGQLYAKDIKGYMQYNYLNYVNHKLFSFIEKYMTIYQKNIQEIFDLPYIPFDIVDNLNTTEEIHEYFLDIINKMMLDVNLKSDSNQVYGLKVSQAIQILEKHYRENIKLEEVADQLAIHKVYLSRIFKEETGLTLSQFTQNLIVEDAKKMLLNTNLKIYEIGEILGFDQSQINQFNQVFKKQTGSTPSRYRKKYYQQ